MKSSQPALILLPGLDGTDILFQPLLRELDGKWPLQVWTLPPQGPQDYESLLQHFLPRLLELPSCILLGWSFSGPLVLMLAQAAPHKVRAVTIAASFVTPPHPLLKWTAPIVSGPAFQSWRFLRRIPLWLGRTRQDPMRQAKNRTWREVRASLLAIRMRVVARVDARPALSACAAPMLYIAAREDGVVPARSWRQMQALRPDMRLVHTAGHHLALFSHAREAAQVMLDFMTSLEGNVMASKPAQPQDRQALFTTTTA